MKHWKKILTGGVVLVVAIFAAAIAIITSLDFNEYKGLIAEQVKEATGRDLTIAGDLNLELSLNPAVAVEGVSFANAPWGSRKEMATLKRFAAEVELMPLISGDVRVKRLVLVGLDLLAETDAKGSGNWELGKAAKKPEKADPAAGSSGPLPVVQKVRIEDLTVTYKDGKTGQKTSLKLDNMDIQSAGPNDSLAIALAGSLNGNAIKASGELGPLDILLNGGKPYPLSLNLSAPGVAVDVAGAIAEPRKARGLNLTLKVDGQDLAATAKAAGVAIPKVPPVSLSAVLSDPEGGYSLGNLDAKIGTSDIKGQVSVKLAGVKRPTVNADLSSSLLDLDSLLPKQSGAEKPAAATEKKDKVFPSDPLPLDGLKAADATFKYKAQRITTGVIPVENLNLSLALSNGRLEIKSLKADISGGKIDGKITADSSRPALGLSVNLNADKIDYGALLKDLKLTDIATGKVDPKIDIKGNGASVAPLMAGLNGKTRIVTEGGKIESGVLNVVSSDIMAALPFVDSKGDKEIRCGVIDFDIRKGQANAKSLVFETGGLSMIGVGGLNLAEETIDLKIDPRAKKVSLMKLAMVPVNVGGTFAEPSALPDVGGAAIGAVTGAVSTATDIAKGGLSSIGNIVGTVTGQGGDEKSGESQNSLDDTDYCKQALAGKAVVRSQPKPKAKPASSSTSTSTAPASEPPPASQEPQPSSGSPAGTVEELGKGIGGALKGLFGK